MSVKTKISVYCSRTLKKRRLPPIMVKKKTSVLIRKVIASPTEFDRSNASYLEQWREQGPEQRWDLIHQQVHQQIYRRRIHQEAVHSPMRCRYHHLHHQKSLHCWGIASSPPSPRPSPTSSSPLLAQAFSASLIPSRKQDGSWDPLLSSSSPSLHTTA